MLYIYNLFERSFRVIMIVLHLQVSSYDLQIVKPIRNSKFSLEIFSDSSLTGWEAYCKHEKIHCFWSHEERKLHINYLELLAAFFALKSFVKNSSNCNILLRIDNTTAISYINRMGGINNKKLSETAKKMWMWCERRNIWLFASYIQSFTLASKVVFVGHVFVSSFVSL